MNRHYLFILFILAGFFGYVSLIMFVMGYEIVHPLILLFYLTVILLFVKIIGAFFNLFNFIRLRAAFIVIVFILLLLTGLHHFYCKNCSNIRFKHNVFNRSDFAIYRRSNSLINQDNESNY